MYIFDIDGTLLNTIDSISFHLNETLKKYELGAIPREKVLEFVGNGPRVLIGKTLDYVGFSGDEILKEEIYNRYNEAYDNDPLYLTKPFEGIKKALDTLKENGEIIAAFSNKPDETSNRVLKSIFGEKYFDYILGYREDYKRKPSPEGIMIIANHFDVPFSDILYFGDSEVDMKCGRNASIFTVGCSWGFRKREVLEKENPDVIIDSPREITSIKRI
ncbi:MULTISPECIES: HAD family hydrolase [Anaerococcus]|uniref:HAD family hydrolase n=1 Tax=Anaerococcus cruorum TaxID=3115617 RepID=A0ABW9MV73_9FIRM